MDVRRQAGHVARTLADGDVGARDVHSRSDENAVRDRVAHRHVVEGAIYPHIPHRRETGEQGDPCVRDGRIGGLDRRSLENVERLRIRQIGQVGVAIHQSGQHGHVGQIDDRGTVGYGHIGADRFDRLAAHQNELIGQALAGHHIDEVHKQAATTVWFWSR